MDTHLFVSVLIQIFVSTQDELSKTDLLFQRYDNIFAKISSSEIEKLLEKYIQLLGNVKEGNKKSWRHDTFCKNYAAQSKIQKNKNSKPINLTFYLDYGALTNEEHLDTLTDIINRHKNFKGSLDYNLKVILPEALIKLAQVTLKCNKLQAELK